MNHTDRASQSNLTTARRDLPLRRTALSLLFSLSGLASAAPAHAYDLSRIEASPSEAGGDAGETVFVEGIVGAWLPWDLFDSNHTTSVTVGAEMGVTVLKIRGHQLAIGGGFTYSPQTLEDHLNEASTVVMQGFGGVRYLPGPSCVPDVGCAFLEASLGLTWDTAMPEPGHDPAKGELTLNLGAGYRFHLGNNLHIGARIDLGYLQENYSREIGWLTPSLFAGARF